MNMQDKKNTAVRHTQWKVTDGGWGVTDAG